MLHVLVGEDDYSIRQAIGEIKKGIGDPSALMTNMTVLDGRSVSPEQLRSACDTIPFLADKRLVIVEGLLERFESNVKSGRKKSARQSDPSDDCRLIVEGVRQLPASTELVITGGKVTARNPLYRELAALTRMKTFPLLKSAELRTWIQHRVAGSCGEISPAAIALLIRFIGNNLWVLSAEIEKLVLYAGSRRIEEADVRELVSYAQEASVFSMVDALLEFRLPAARECLQQLYRQGTAPAQLLVMLARQLRIIFQIKELREEGKSRPEIQSALGLTHDFVLQKAWEQGNRYTAARLKELYHRLLETDVSIKTGKYEGETAFDILVTEMGRPGALRP